MSKTLPAFQIHLNWIHRFYLNLCQFVPTNTNIFYRPPRERKQNTKLFSISKTSIRKMQRWKMLILTKKRRKYLHNNFFFKTKILTNNTQFWLSHNRWNYLWTRTSFDFYLWLKLFLMTVQIVDNKGRVFNSSFRKPRTL